MRHRSVEVHRRSCLFVLRLVMKKCGHRPPLIARVSFLFGWYVGTLKSNILPQHSFSFPLGLTTQSPRCIRKFQTGFVVALSFLPNHLDICEAIKRRALLRSRVDTYLFEQDKTRIVLLLSPRHFRMKSWRTGALPARNIYCSRCFGNISQVLFPIFLDFTHFFVLALFFLLRCKLAPT